MSTLNFVCANLQKIFFTTWETRLDNSEFLDLANGRTAATVPLSEKGRMVYLFPMYRDLFGNERNQSFDRPIGCLMMID